jgi:hypothetical protein
VAGQGNFSASSASATLVTEYTSCLQGTTLPSLFAVLTNPEDPGLGEMQLLGALVSTQTTQGETETLYRGTAVMVNGPDPAVTPIEFAADVDFQQPSNITTIRIAFYGTAPILAPSMQQSSSSASGTSSTTTPSPSDTQTADPTTPTSSPSG